VQAPFTFGNHFTAVAGGQTIESISIAWSGFGGDPITVKLWSDPNGDGNPNDALLLSSVAGVTANPNNVLGPALFTTYDIPDVTLFVGQSFFVGVTVLADTFIPLDLTPRSAMKGGLSELPIFSGPGPNP
jgi:hypothetical protein